MAWVRIPSLTVPKQDGDNADFGVEKEVTAPWDRYNNGFATAYMKSNGYKPGNVLGKDENGIRTPIKPAQTTFTNNKNTQKSILFAGTSMIGGVDEHKLSSKHTRVKVHSHSGATIEEMRHHDEALLSSALKKCYQLILKKT